MEGRQILDAVLIANKEKDFGINELGGSSGVLPQQLSLCW